MRDVPGVARRAAASSRAASGGRGDSDGDPPVNIAIAMEKIWKMDEHGPAIVVLPMKYCVF